MHLTIFSLNLLSMTALFVILLYCIRYTKYNVTYFYYIKKIQLCEKKVKLRKKYDVIHDVMYE